MKGLLLFCAAALLAFAPTSISAQAKADPNKTLTTTGAVTAISADSLTIKAKAAELTFFINGATAIVGHGNSTKKNALKGDNKPIVATEFVHVGDTVRVAYHDLGDRKHAAEIRVTKLKK